MIHWPEISMGGGKFFYFRAPYNWPTWGAVILIMLAILRLVEIAVEIVRGWFGRKKTRIE